MTFFAAFREGQFFAKSVMFTIFFKNPEAIPGIGQAPMVWPNSGPSHA